MDQPINFAAQRDTSTAASDIRRTWTPPLLQSLGSDLDVLNNAGGVSDGSPSSTS